MQVSAVKSAKRLKYAGIGQRAVHDPLFVSVQPDGSDAWRLEPVIQLLKDGGVSVTPAVPPVNSSRSNIRNGVSNGHAHVM